MALQAGIPHLREVLLFLALAGLLIPLLQRLRVNAVLGFLVVGMLVGPFGLGRLAQVMPWVAWVTIPRIEGVVALAEIGVLFLMFMIGLDLSGERLRAMRRQVFGTGARQVILTALVVGAVAYGWGNSLAASLILGVVLAFSSTAVVMQLLAARRITGTPMGRMAFAVLLFQDLAVVPLLILIGGLAGGDAGSLGGAVLASLAKGGIAIALIYWLGRRVLRPVFRRVAATRQPDVFVAMTLLSTLGIAALTHLAGLSMALGAFLAGLLLAETEYRHEIEVTVEPFRGLLMGVFFMSVGMGIDLAAILRDPVWLPLSVLGLFLVKGAVAALVLRQGGLGPGHAIEAGLLLGQGGEFAFIVIGAAMLGGVIPVATGQFMMLMVGLSMMATPVVARLAERAGRWVDARRPFPAAGADRTLAGLEGHVVIAGFGRVGQLIASLLDEQHLPYVAIDTDAALVTQHHAAGLPVYVGDAARPDMLRRLNIHAAAAIVLTMDDPGAAVHAMRAIRDEAPEVPTLARARDEGHARALMDEGASAVIPEALEAGLQLAAAVLGRSGVSEDAVLTILEQTRARRLAAVAPARARPS